MFFFVLPYQHTIEIIPISKQNPCQRACIIVSLAYRRKPERTGHRTHVGHWLAGISACVGVRVECSTLPKLLKFYQICWYDKTGNLMNFFCRCFHIEGNRFETKHLNSKNLVKIELKCRNLKTRILPTLFFQRGNVGQWQCTCTPPDPTFSFSAVYHEIRMLLFGILTLFRYLVILWFYKTQVISCSCFESSRSLFFVFSFWLEIEMLCLMWYVKSCFCL